MRAWFISEQPYPQAWDADPVTLRVTLPSKHFDPKIGADLLNRYYDEYMAADELGWDIMLNEHHSTATCLSVSCLNNLSILARITKKARLLTLGIPICHRPDPVRIAEELAYADVLSRGRTEIGFIKGIAYEISAQNSNPVDLMSRFWEAHDLILKALTTHDGPFNWEGQHFHHRQVNIWPRPYQQPRPNVWISAGNAATAIPVAECGHTIATVFSRDNAKKMFEAYRKRTAELGRPEPNLDRFGYLAMLAIGRTRAEGFAKLAKVKGYLESASIVNPAFQNPPGLFPPEANAAALQRPSGARIAQDHLIVKKTDGTPINTSTASMEDLVDAGLAYAGTPDDVFQQIKRMYDHVGGFGHLIALAHGGTLSHEDTVDNLDLFSREVMPRLRELRPPQGQSFDARGVIRENALSA